MKTLFKRLWAEDDGVLTFEWILLISLLVIGVIGGLSAVRQALVFELGDVSGAIAAMDQSFSMAPDSHGTCPAVVFQQTPTQSCWGQASSTAPATCP